MKLSEIANISTGYSFRSKLKHDPAGDTKVIQMSDVDKYRGILRKNLITISNFNPRKDRYYLDPGDVIMTSKGYNLVAFVVPGSLNSVVASNSFLVLKPDYSKITPEYLAWFLNSNRIQHYFKSLAAGTNIPNLSIRALEGMEINLPTIKQQNNVVSLEMYKNSKVVLHQIIAEKTEKMVDALLQKKVDEWTSNN